MSKVLKIIIGLLIAFAIFVLMFKSLGVIMKTLKYSFINGNEIVYKGNVIATFSDDCMISTTEEYKEIKLICPKTGFNKTWINGKIQE